LPWGGRRFREITEAIAFRVQARACGDECRLFLEGLHREMRRRQGPVGCAAGGAAGRSRPLGVPQGDPGRMDWDADALGRDIVREYVMGRNWRMTMRWGSWIGTDRLSSRGRHRGGVGAANYTGSGAGKISTNCQIGVFSGLKFAATACVLDCVRCYLPEGMDDDSRSSWEACNVLPDIAFATKTKPFGRELIARAMAAYVYHQGGGCCGHRLRWLAGYRTGNYARPAKKAM